jgi:polar amino acid transport system substrate-binding protein
MMDEIIKFMKGLKKNLAFGLVLLLVFYCGQVSATKVSILTEHLAPFQIVTTNAIEGLSTEIVEATLAQAQYEYAISAHPWALSYRRAQHGKNTCIYSLARIPEREPLFKWVGHIASSTISLYSLNNSQITISAIEEAKKYNIAVIRDDVTHHFLLSKKFIENQNLYVVDNYDALLKLLDLSSRHIDLVVLNDDLLRNRVKNLGETTKYKNVFQFKALTLNFHFACSLNTEQVIVDNLINAMMLLEQRGVLLTIRKKWQKNMVSLIN